MEKEDFEKHIKAHELMIEHREKDIRNLNLKIDSLNGNINQQRNLIQKLYEKIDFLQKVKIK